MRKGENNMKNVGVFLYSDSGETENHMFNDDKTLYRIFITNEEQYTARANRFEKIYVSKKFDKNFVENVLSLYAIGYHLDKRVEYI